MTNVEMDAGAENTGVRLLPARRSQNTTMALVATSGSRAIAAERPPPPEAPAADAHLLTDADIRLLPGGHPFPIV